jgi:hypothetical protein
MTKGRHARTVFVNIRLREELQAYAAQALDSASGCGQKLGCCDRIHGAIISQYEKL